MAQATAPLSDSTIRIDNPCCSVPIRLPTNQLRTSPIGRLRQKLSNLRQQLARAGGLADGVNNSVSIRSPKAEIWRLGCDVR